LRLRLRGKAEAGSRKQSINDVLIDCFVGMGEDRILLAMTRLKIVAIILPLSASYIVGEISFKLLLKCLYMKGGVNV